MKQHLTNLANVIIEYCKDKSDEAYDWINGINCDNVNPGEYLSCGTCFLGAYCTHRTNAEVTKLAKEYLASSPTTTLNPFDELIKEFREWSKAWDAYNRLITSPPPPSKDEFIEDLKQRYTVTKR